LSTFKDDVNFGVEIVVEHLNEFEDVRMIETSDELDFTFQLAKTGAGARQIAEFDSLHCNLEIGCDIDSEIDSGGGTRPNLRCQEVIIDLADVAVEGQRIGDSS
jgi:hypothetical protein